VIAEGVDDPSGAEARQLAAEMAMLSGDVSGALDHAREAVALAERAGDAAILVESLGTLCHYETFTGRITPGLLERAVELEQTVVRPSNNYSPREILGLRLMYADRLDAARGLLEASLVAATELDRMSLLVHLTQLESRAGNLARAREHAREGNLVAEQQGGWALSAGAFVTALAAALVGQVDQAREAAERGTAFAAETETGLFRILNLWARGFLELSLGDAAVADRHLHELPERLEGMGYVNPGVRPVYGDAIEARIAVGDLGVEELIERLAGRGELLDQPWAQATAGRCRGLLLAARGDVHGALAALEAALEHHERSPQPLERGRTLLVLGALQRRAKRRGEARDTLRRALELFDLVGAALWAEKAAEELARIPGRGRSSGELTETERRVAELVTGGLSNREVAATMFVSVRTVESNLSRIYAKLGVRSRTELVRRLADSGGA
jgi:DNA-binding CsgD family transcriptional regulator